MKNILNITFREIFSHILPLLTSPQTGEGQMGVAPQTKAGQMGVAPQTGEEQMGVIPDLIRNPILKESDSMNIGLRLGDRSDGVESGLQIEGRSDGNQKSGVILKKGIVAFCFALLFVFGFGVNEAGAGNYNCRNFGVTTDLSAKVKILGDEDADYKKLKEDYTKTVQKLKTLCEKANDDFSWGSDYWYMIKTSEILDKMKELGIYDQYEKELKNLEKYTQQLKEDHKVDDNIACGEDKPNGCNTAAGEKCWQCISHAGGLEQDNMSLKQFHCAVENPCGIFDRAIAANNSGGQGTNLTTQASMLNSTIDTNANGETVMGYYGLALDNKGLNDIWNPKEETDELTNKECDIEGQKKAYLGTCYSCTIVANLIRVFMNAAAKNAPLTQEAGVRIRVIGMVIWFAFFVLHRISSFVSIEPMKMLQELFSFLFKCLLVYTVITSGLLNIINMMVNPLLTAGADYGMTMIDTVSDVKLDYTSVDQKQYKIGSGELINQKVFDKIMGISKKADAAMSINFVIGNAIMCHSRHAGAIVIAKKLTDTANLPPFHFPDFWLWICGALIWFFAFMVTMGINFYLLDLSFKIGFALLALPITLGLYPFNKFKGKFVECLKIIVNAAGTFMFLGITAAMSIVLISSALGGTEQLFEAIKADNKEYISQKFAVTGSSFLLILFAFLYSHKLISETISHLVDRFFGSVTSGMNVMNEKTTQKINFAKQKTLEAASFVLTPVGGAAVGAVKKAAGTVAKRAARTVVKGAMRFGRAAGRRGAKSSSHES